MPSNVQLSFINLTGTTLHVSLPGITLLKPLALSDGALTHLGEVSVGKMVEISLSEKPEEGPEIYSNKIIFKRRMHGRSWEPLSTHNSTWRLYRAKIGKGHQRIFVFPQRPLASWMRDLPDSLPLSSVCLPGTHETMALYGWPFSQCQDITLTEQFQYGVRIVDIRIVLVDGQLRTYHGATPERATFTDILEAVSSFLESYEGKSETIVVSIMEESSFMPSSPLFSSLVHDAILSEPSKRSLWYLENRIPRLGEVRGKAILFSRFGNHGEGWEGGKIGIHPPIWPNSRREGFEWELTNCRVRTQDWYAIPSFLDIPEKFAVAVEMLIPQPTPNGKQDLAITFFSAARVPLALPSTVACGFGWSVLGVEGVNSRAGRWLLDQLGDDTDTTIAPLSKSESEVTLVGDEKRYKSQPNGRREPRLRGWVLMDFALYPYELGLIPLLVECNWRGRVKGEEGWDC